MNDKYSIIDDIKTELTPIKDYLTIYISGDNIKLSLKQNITFKEFNNYFPTITKKSLIKLFDYCEKYPKETKEALKND